MARTERAQKRPRYSNIKSRQRKLRGCYEKTEYTQRIENLLADRNKFKKLNEDPTIKREEKLTRYLRNLKQKKSITKAFYDSVRPCGSQPARLYGLPKIHKPDHPLRPICSSIGSYNYRLASKLASILSPHSFNEYTVKNSFEFVNELHNLHVENTHLASFDVSSLFTNIPLQQTIEIALDYTFENREKV